MIQSVLILAVSLIASSSLTGDEDTLWGVLSGDETTEYAPDHAWIFRGIVKNGSVEDLNVSDDQRLVLWRHVSPNPCEANWSITVETHFATDTPETLSFSIESHANTPNIGQGIAVWNWKTGWYSIYFDFSGCYPFGPVPAFKDGIYTIDLTDFIDDIVESGTGRIRVRTRANLNGPILLWRPTIAFDRMWWTTTEK
jgi:hypothetical protein